MNNKGANEVASEVWLLVAAHNYKISMSFSVSISQSDAFHFLPLLENDADPWIVNQARSASASSLFQHLGTLGNTHVHMLSLSDL